MTTKKVQIGIEVDRKGATRGYKQFSDDVSQQNKRIRTEFQKTKTASAGLGLNLKSLAAAAGGLYIFHKANQLIRESVRLAGEQASAEAKVAQTIKSTGMAAGLTSDELKEMARGYQNLTTFGDEVILRGQSMLLTFKNIGKDVFPAATETMLNLATAMGTDVKESAIQLGKALNDPITGLTALRRVGITFNEQQEFTIKAMQKSGDIAGAQRLILKELESQFGGLSKAVALTGEGPLIQFRNIVGDVKELLGDEFIPLIIKATSGFKDWLIEGQKTGRLKEIFESIAAGIELFIDNIDTIISLGKQFFIVFAVSKIQAITAAIISMTTKLAATNPIFAGMTAVLVGLEAATLAMENRAKSLAGTDFLMDPEQIKNVRNAIIEVERLRNEQEKTLIVLKERGTTERTFNQLNKERLTRESEIAAQMRIINQIAGEGFINERSNLEQILKGLGAELSQRQKLAAEKAKTVKAAVPPEEDLLTKQVKVAKGSAIDLREITLKSAQDRIKLQQEINEMLLAAQKDSREKDIEAAKLELREKTNILLNEDALSAEFREAARIEHRAKLAEIDKKWDKIEEAQAKENADRIIAIQKAKTDAALALGRRAAGLAAEVFGAGKAIFLFQQSLAAGEVVINTMRGIAAAIAEPFGVGIPRIPFIKATGALALATIAAQTIKGFQRGGFLDEGPTTGDRTLFRGNRGELILNPAQQRNLLALANGRGGRAPVSISFGDINITAPGGNADLIAQTVNQTMQERLRDVSDILKEKDALLVT